ncbi:MAG: M15 family metallopeptidase [Bacteroidales bacterium]|nr:M15 family metallopeptidase [Bacteroidales bacterium]
MKTIHASCLLLALCLLSGCTGRAISCDESCKLCEKDIPEHFVLVSDVIPDAMLDIRYHCAFNFIGERIPGYEQPVAIMTRSSCDSLKAVADELREKGLTIKIFDAYRPQCAVDFFMEWALDTLDVRTREYFYPELDKTVLVPQQYVARQSSHTRGSTVDLTLFDKSSQKDLDMGGTFDYFGLVSHPDLLPGEEAGACSPINEEQYRNRMLLREAMLRHGFLPYECEWWHFTLDDEPFPDTYFTFPVSERFFE